MGKMRVDMSQSSRRDGRGRTGMEERQRKGRESGGGLAEVRSKTVDSYKKARDTSG